MPVYHFLRLWYKRKEQRETDVGGVWGRVLLSQGEFALCWGNFILCEDDPGGGVDIKYISKV